MGTSIEAVRPVTLDIAGVALIGDLGLPADPHALVVFAHGSGSSRHSPRNAAVAEALQREGVGTLLLDLLTAHEDLADATTAEFRFDIPLLAERLVGAIDWATANPQTSSLPIGLFGASTGAAAALIAAATRTGAVRAVVSRGGRPDLAEGSLDGVTAPTLLIVGHPVRNTSEETYHRGRGGEQQSARKRTPLTSLGEQVRRRKERSECSCG